MTCLLAIIIIYRNNVAHAPQTSLNISINKTTLYIYYYITPFFFIEPYSKQKSMELVYCKYSRMVSCSSPTHIHRTEFLLRASQTMALQERI